MAFSLILVTIILILIRPQDYISGLQDAQIVNFFLISTTIAWFMGQRQKMDFPQLPLLLGFTACIIVSVLISDGAGHVWDDLMTFLPSVMLFLFISTVVTSRRRVTAVMDLIAVCAFIIAIHSIQQYRNGVGWTGLEVLIEHGIKRVRYLGIFNDPNDLGLLLVTSLPIVFYWLEREVHRSIKLLYLGVLAVLMYGIYLTNSRGSMIATGVILLLMFWRQYGAMKALVLGSAAVVAALSVSSRLATLEVGEQSAWERVYAWHEGISMMRESPLFGIGYLNFGQQYYMTAHNSFILVLAETGVVGYTLWFTFVATIFFLLWRLIHLQSSALEVDMDDEQMASWEEYQKIGWTLFLSLIAYLITGFFLSQSYIVYVFILYGLILGYYHLGRNEYEFVPEQVLGMSEMARWAVYSVLSVIALFVMVKILIRIAA